MLEIEKFCVGGKARKKSQNTLIIHFITNFYILENYKDRILICFQ